MTKRYYVYRLFDDKDGQEVFQGRIEIPEQTDSATMNNDDARSMVADAAIRQMIRSSARPVHSHIQFCELTEDDERITGAGDEFAFDWSRCDTPQELELKLGEED
ncbi:MAG: hypothetical protein ACQETD_02285 [Pseudomonadota bacterium]